MNIPLHRDFQIIEVQEKMNEEKNRRVLLLKR
jgi:hypothetical protein